jgi:hypothetical protein
VKRSHLAAIVIPLALAMPSCGGDSKDSPRAEGTTTAPPSGQAQSDAQPGAQDRSRPGSSSSKQSRNGNGGSSAADAERAARSDAKSKTASGGTSQKKQGDRAHANLSPAEQLERLSPKERRDLDLDLYKQGKDYCYAYGPQRLAEDYQIQDTDPAGIAERYARIREKAVPALILPFQQGCLAGFRRFERNPPKN